MKYKVLLSPAAELDQKKLDPVIARRVNRKYSALAEMPRPPGCLRLTDVEPPTWRIKIGDWRVLYDIDDRAHVVVVLAILPRDKAYKR